MRAILDSLIIQTSFFLLSLYSLSYQAQENLVPNPSFEEYNHCPDTANGYYITAAKDWLMPSLGTSDYFNSCSPQIFLPNSTPYKVPNNYMGYQNARTGNAYAGFYYQADALFPYAEYIEVKLRQPLLDKRRYRLGFYVSNADASPFCFNSIGCYFSVNPVTVNNGSPLPFIPQAQSDPNVFLCDTSAWQEVVYDYTAKGQEEYITIGIFTPPLIKNAQGQVPPYPRVYLYIDDVSLTGVGSIANVFTPNNDGINDLIFFGSNSTQVCIYDRWGIIVYESSTNLFWDGKAKNGELCTDGVYYYVVRTTSNESLKGLFTLFK